MPSEEAIAAMARQLGWKPEKVRANYEQMLESIDARSMTPEEADSQLAVAFAKRHAGVGVLYGRDLVATVRAAGWGPVRKSQDSEVES